MCTKSDNTRLLQRIGNETSGYPGWNVITTNHFLFPRPHSTVDFKPLDRTGLSSIFQTTTRILSLPQPRRSNPPQKISDEQPEQTTKEDISEERRWSASQNWLRRICRGLSTGGNHLNSCPIHELRAAYFTIVADPTRNCSTPRTPNSYFSIEVV
jgi:hypothetical protein